MLANPETTFCQLDETGTRKKGKSADISLQSRKCFWKQCSARIFMILLPEYLDGEQLLLVTVAFIIVCILAYDHIKPQEEKLAYCVNYNRCTVCLVFSFLFPLLSESYWGNKSLLTVAPAAYFLPSASREILFCQPLFDAIARCMWWHSLAEVANTHRDFSSTKEAASCHAF